ncbi:hypothetical protein ACOSQ3_027132 [Xanthoceras sorbifolium]
MAHGICEGLWVKRVLSELRLSLEEPINMFCNNKATICIAKNPVHHDRTKHIEIDRHFIKEKIDCGVLKLFYIPTAQQAADLLTKALSRNKFEELSSKLRMISIYNPAWGVLNVGLKRVDQLFPS